MVTLPDGRGLGYASYGDPEGIPCFAFHGIPGSRFEGSLFHEAALSAGVRLLEIDRPGMGLSSPAPGRTVASIAADVAALADALGIETFAVFGWSGGGPYALACSALLADRVPVTVVASSPRPSSEPIWRELTGFRRHLWRLGTRRTWPLVPVMWWMGLLIRAVLPLARFAASRKPASERPPAEALDGMHEAWRQGVRYIAQDLHVVAADWGFELGAITGTVHLWHGREDTAVPFAMGEALAREIPGCQPHFVSGGHRVCVDRAAEVLAPVGGLR
jgi:pimeloyl-ACP methyl ester carboxylesterase